MCSRLSFLFGIMLQPITNYFCPESLHSLAQPMGKSQVEGNAQRACNAKPQKLPSARAQPYCLQPQIRGGQQQEAGEEARYIAHDSQGLHDMYEQVDGKGNKHGRPNVEAPRPVHQHIAGDEQQQEQFFASGHRKSLRAQTA